jgi:hypothetical protein
VLGAETCRLSRWLQSVWSQIGPKAVRKTVGTAGFEPATPLTPSHLPAVAGRGSVSLSGHLTSLDSRLAWLGVA